MLGELDLFELCQQDRGADGNTKSKSDLGSSEKLIKITHFGELEVLVCCMF